MINKIKQATSEMAGTSDIGLILSPSEYDKAQADDYIFHEDGEKIYFLIKSKKDEYCFTERALIHVDGKSAISSKRNVRRYEYFTNPLKSNVEIETAGTIDLDVEIKFTMGESYFSIDVNKSQLELLKDLYKVLYSMHLEHEREIYNQKLKSESFNTVISSFNINPRNGINTANLVETLKQFNEEAIRANSMTIKKNYSELFEKYINN